VTPNHFAAATYNSCLAAKPETSGLARFSFAEAWFSFVVAWVSDSEAKSSVVAAEFSSASTPIAGAGEDARAHSVRHGATAITRSEARTPTAITVLPLARKTGQRIFSIDFY
jgi:hypothetical protein